MPTPQAEEYSERFSYNSIRTTHMDGTVSSYQRLTKEDVQEIFDDGRMSFMKDLQEEIHLMLENECDAAGIISYLQEKYEIEGKC